MAQKTLETHAQPQIVVEHIGNELSVKGWDRPQVLARSSSDNDILLEERDNRIVVRAAADCVLYVPAKATLAVHQVGTHARFKALGGDLTIGQVGADLILRDVSACQVEKALADLSAKRVRGDLLVKHIGGNAIIRDVDGQFSADGIGGQLHLRDVSGGITVEVGGNASIDFSPVPWQGYAIQAGGNIRCRVPGDANVNFEIINGAQDIRIKTPDRSEKLNEGEYTFTLGEGGAQVKLAAGGSVRVLASATTWEATEHIDVDFGAELGSVAEEIAKQATSQLEAQLDMISAHLDAKLSGLASAIPQAGLSEERAQEIQARLEAARERAAQRAEAAAERARARLELKIAAAQRKAERKARAAAARAARKAGRKRGHSRFSHPSPFEPSDPVSDDERLLILQMLQDQKITLEQAEQLLAAVEGKGD